MLTQGSAQNQSLRLLCLEDNPLIVFHLQQMIEDMGHSLMWTFESFEEMQGQLDVAQIDCALVDIDLTDGRTGPEAATWLGERGVPVLFVTGQDRLAHELNATVVGVISKPVSDDALRAGLDRLAAAREARRRHG